MVVSADDGSEFTYTGSGGQEEGGGGAAKKQVKDQVWTGDNLSLKVAYEMKTPIRVIRAHTDRTYVYEGLYVICEEPKRVVSFVEVAHLKHIRLRC